MKVVLIVLDGVGAGEMPDAALYGDTGSNTLGHVADAAGGLRVPQLAALGLGNIVDLCGVAPAQAPRASFGKMAALSKGKDSTTGHWELAGLVTRKEFPTFPRGFPAELLERFKAVTGCAGVLGNQAASGTAIIAALGGEHLRTGFPIVYTSADSVFQIAAHEAVIPVPRLYEICERTRTDVCTGEFQVGRVIARPFEGVAGAFARTANRRDFSLPPPGPTLLDALTDAGIETVTIGKVDELFAGRGVSRAIHTRNNADGIEQILRAARLLNHGLIFANLVDFDTLYGHRNDPAGFARALEEFDRSLPDLIATLGPEDLLIITADHGNDPVTPGTDHSREYVPILSFRKNITAGTDLGTLDSFTNVARMIRDFFGLGR